MSELVSKFAATLKRSARMPRDQLLRYQENLLVGLIEHARRTVPFYRDTGRLDGITTAQGRVDWDRWAEIPVLSRAEAQMHETALRSDDIPQACLPLLPVSTTGSTGRPLAFVSNALAHAGALASIERGLDWYGIARRGPSAIIRSALKPEEIPEGAEEYRPNVLIWPGRRLVVVQLDVPLCTQVEVLRALGVSTVSTYANHLRLLAEALAEQGDYTPAVMISSGEVLTAQVRAEVSARLPTRIVDLYSTSEIGAAAMEAPDGTMRFSDEIVRPEWGERVANTDGAPIQELIMTPLYSYAMPLIRYAPGDFVELTEHASSEWSLTPVKRIVGRNRGLFRLPDGSRIWPRMKFDECRRIAPLEQIQLVQLRPDFAVLTVKPRDCLLSPEQLSQMAASIERQFDDKLRVEAVADMTLAATGPKALESVISKVA